MRKQKKRIINRQLHDRGYFPNFFRKINKWMSLNFRVNPSLGMGRIEEFRFIESPIK